MEEDAIDTLTILHSFLSLPGELELVSIPRSATGPLLDTGIWDEDALQRASDELIACIRVRIVLKLQDDDRYPLVVRLELPIRVSEGCSDGTPLIKSQHTLNLIQPGYLRRTICDEWQADLGSMISSGTMVDDILAALQHLRELGDQSDLRGLDDEAEPAHPLPSSSEGPLERVWFWFPSLSTREKRKDLVDYAVERGITGFVMAGKPGLLCVEGTGSIIDRYMAAIKSESWSDIPSYQKKVTERHREPITTRAFSNMTEITDDISHGGWRGAKSDMSEVKEYLERMGVGDAFGKVVGSGGFN